jgi:RNA polymerase sigma-70 factor (ECF subfamily)
VQVTTASQRAHDGRPADGLGVRADERFHDADLLARLLEGDDAALREVYDEHAALVYGLARKVTGDEAMAADVSQDVFVHLWEHPDRVDLSRGSLRAYLGVVTHRRSLDALRRTTRARDRDVRAGRDEPLARTSHELDVVEVDAALARSARLAMALEQLPVDQRIALELAYFRGCTYRQVAVQLGIAEGTAKSRLRLALARLRDLMDSEDES